MNVTLIDGDTGRSRRVGSKLQREGGGGRDQVAAFPCPGTTKGWGTRAKKRKRDEKEQTRGSRREWGRPETSSKSQPSFPPSVRDRKAPPALLTGLHHKRGLGLPLARLCTTHLHICPRGGLEGGLKGGLKGVSLSLRPRKAGNLGCPSPRHEGISTPPNVFPLIPQPTQQLPTLDQLRFHEPAIGAQVETAPSCQEEFCSPCRGFNAPLSSVPEEHQHV